MANGLAETLDCAQQHCLQLKIACDGLCLLHGVFCCADIVFLRSWYPVSVPQLYNPVTSLLLPVGQKDSWMGMRTLGQLKHDLDIRNKPNADSLYKVDQLQSANNLKNEP